MCSFFLPLVEGELWWLSVLQASRLLEDEDEDARPKDSPAFYPGCTYRTTTEVYFVRTFARTKRWRIKSNGYGFQCSCTTLSLTTEILSSIRTFRIMYFFFLFISSHCNRLVQSYIVLAMPSVSPHHPKSLASLNFTTSNLAP